MRNERTRIEKTFQYPNIDTTSMRMDDWDLACSIPSMIIGPIPSIRLLHSDRLFDRWVIGRIVKQHEREKKELMAMVHRRNLHRTVRIKNPSIILGKLDFDLLSTVGISLQNDVTFHLNVSFIPFMLVSHGRHLKTSMHKKQ